MQCTRKEVTYIHFPTENEVDRFGSKVASIVDMYLDYLNNFLSVAAFSDHYDLAHSEASQVIDLGREILNRKNTSD